MAIIIKNLTYVFMPDSPFMSVALENVTLQIDDGEFVAIIGHTGSGKSTLVQHFNGLLKPSSGTVIVNGINTAEKSADLTALRRKVGLVFQYPEYQLFEETVERDVAFGPNNLGLSKQEVEERVRRAIAQVHLDFDAVAQRSPFELSGGQRRRVAIAGILAMEPEILVLDEPSAGLDPRGRQEVLDMISEIHQRQHCTVVLVSHNMDEVARIAQRVLVINQGRVMMSGTPKEIFARGEQLKSVGLDLPSMAQLCDAMRARGVDVPDDIITVEDFHAFFRERLRAKDHA